MPIGPISGGRAHACDIRHDRANVRGGARVDSYKLQGLFCKNNDGEPDKSNRCFISDICMCKTHSFDRQDDSYFIMVLKKQLRN